MKALNRAIARTVSQIARHAGEGCHVPMIMALENHLDALLTMERKMLEGVQDVAWPVPGYSWFTPEQVAALTKGMTYGSWYEKEKEQPAPDVIDMTDPANWQEGDIVLRVAPSFTAGSEQGEEYVVASVGLHLRVKLVSKDDGTSFDYPLGMLRRDKTFKWLRHSEVQP